MIEQTSPRHVQLRLENCVWCGKPLPDGRYDRRTHNECRLKLWRWQKRLTKVTQELKDKLETIDDYLKYDVTFIDATHELIEIEARIRSIKAKHKIVSVK